jgi:hypothetical protein
VATAAANSSSQGNVKGVTTLSPAGAAGAAASTKAGQDQQRHPDATVPDTSGSVVNSANGCTGTQKARLLGDAKEVKVSGTRDKEGARQLVVEGNSRGACEGQQHSTVESGMDEEASLAGIRAQNADFVQSLSAVEVLFCTAFSYPIHQGRYICNGRHEWLTEMATSSYDSVMFAAVRHWRTGTLGLWHPLRYVCTCSHVIVRHNQFA